MQCCVFLLTEFTKAKQLLRIKATSVMISKEKQEAEDIKSNMCPTTL